MAQEILPCQYKEQSQASGLSVTWGVRTYPGVGIVIDSTFAGTHKK